MRDCRRENDGCCNQCPEPPQPNPGCSGCLVAALLVAGGLLLLTCLFGAFPILPLL